MLKKSLAYLTENRIHVLIWFAFFFYESVMVYLLFGVNSHPLTYAAHYVIILCFFYFHSHVLLDWMGPNLTRRLYWAPVLIFLEVALYILCQYLVDRMLILARVITVDSYPLSWAFALRNLYRGLYFLGFSTGYFFLRNYWQQRRKAELLEKQRLYGIIKEQRFEHELAKTQNAYLKAQINPHFLFNTLDYVYSQVAEQSSDVGKTIVSLAQMMRFAIESDQGDGAIMLEEEIAQVENLIFLHQVRRPTQLQIDFCYTQEVAQLRLIPLVLLTLVENMFKHGDLSPGEKKATVNLAVVQQVFHLETFNALAAKKMAGSTKAGLANIAQRLRFAYGEGCTFSFGSVEGGAFRTSLSVPVSVLVAPFLSEARSVDSGTGSPREFADWS